MTSDRAPAPNLSSAPLPPDAVYPAVIENTREFIAALPETPCEALLDIGTGSGIAALLAASRYARHAWGADITARAVHFAEFNRRLNGLLPTLRSWKAICIALVEGMTFDRIVAHPPYVPAAKDAPHLPRRLARRGTGNRFCGAPSKACRVFYVPAEASGATMAMAADCEGESFEERIRKMAGRKRGRIRPGAGFALATRARAVYRQHARPWRRSGGRDALLGGALETP